MRVFAFLLSAVSVHLVVLSFSFGPLNQRVDDRRVGVMLVQSELNVPTAGGVQERPSISPYIQADEQFPEVKDLLESHVAALQDADQDVVERSVPAFAQEAKAKPQIINRQHLSSPEKKPQVVVEQAQPETEPAIKQIEIEPTAATALEAPPDTIEQPPSSKADSVMTNKLDADVVARLSTVPQESARPRYGHNPAPAYPQTARRRGWQGTVEFEVRVLSSGQVGELQLRTSSGYKSLDEAAHRAIERWRFSPATISGVAVESWVVIPVHFVLDQENSSR